MGVGGASYRAAPCGRLIPCRDPAQHVDQLVRRGILDHEARHVRGKRRAQLPGVPKHGQDHHPARGHPFMQLSRGGEPVEPRQVDVEHRDVGTLRQGRGHDVRAGRYLGDHLDVFFQVQHGDQRVPQNPHVLRDKDPDHHPSNRANGHISQSLARTSRPRTPGRPGGSAPPSARRSAPTPRSPYAGLYGTAIRRTPGGGSDAGSRATTGWGWLLYFLGLIMLAQAGLTLAAVPGRCVPDRAGGRRSISRSTSGVRMSCMARVILPPGITMMFGRDINESCSMDSR